VGNEKLAGGGQQTANRKPAVRLGIRHANRSQSGCSSCPKKMKGKWLATEVGISEQNLSLLRTAKVKGVRFSTLERICEVYECQPGDILKYCSDSTECD